MKGAWLAQQQSLTSQVQDLTRRTSQLDLNNTNLTRELAQSQQQQQQYQEQIALLQKQLGDTANRLKSEQVATQETSKQLQALQASTTFRGGASISANNSMKQALQTITIPGLEVRQEGEVVRIEIPADKLFTPGSAEMTAEASRILDEVASAIARSYPRQRIIVEGHSDNTPGHRGQRALAHERSIANRLPTLRARRTISPRGNSRFSRWAKTYPLASNATAAGQAKNRRIEVVVYPSKRLTEDRNQGDWIH